MTASSSNKKMSVDRLSELPDSILCYILSFLEMKKASITCLLSKRWQFLWTKLPALRFMEDYGKEMENILKFVNRVHKTLLIYSRHNLERFEVDFRHNYNPCFASDVNVWIRFAVENKVKFFRLLLNNATSRVHMLPQMMYSNPSWITFFPRGCIMAPRGTIQWQSLTKLCMTYVELNDHTFEKIFSGCPILSSLEMAYCRGFHRLEVNSRSFCRLTIEDNDGGGGGDLEISAPHLQTLEIMWDSEYLCLKNMKSLVRAKLYDTVFKCEFPEHCKKRINDLFGSVRHVKMLHLGYRFAKFLSLIARDWQLPRSTTKYLELDIICDRTSILGIALLLESSPNLETLVIHGSRSFRDAEPIPASKNDLNCDLFYLKTVRIKNFGDPNRDNGEPMLTLARILLKRATILEKMVIDFQGFTTTSSTRFYEMTRKLLSYPRVSQEAVVLFC